MSDEQKKVLIPNPVAKFNTANQRIYGVVRQGDTVYLLTVYNAPGQQFAFAWLLMKPVVEKHKFATPQQAFEYYNTAVQVYNYQVDFEKKFADNSEHDDMVEINDYMRKLQPKFIEEAKHGTVTDKATIFKYVEHPEFNPMIQIDQLNYLPCLHSERINQPKMSFVYSLVLPRIGDAEDEFNVNANVEISGFQTHENAAKYQEIYDNAYKNINMSAPKACNQKALEHMKSICNSMRLSATCFKLKKL
ncbi:MAG: hypothetical protein IKZ34_04130 [Alphaproteobacteria bacterium]|nr:hypothetical protein [Alphaproteobacteria bacterium]